MIRDQWNAFRARPFPRLFALWLAWALLLIGFQAAAQARLTVVLPDRVQFWTIQETNPEKYQKDQAYLNERFLNNQVAWDSEYYLSISIAGYDDPEVGTNRVGPAPLSLNYAFMPFYPLVMRLTAWPIALLGLNAIAASALAGVIVSALGALGAMVALYDLARDDLGEEGGMRAAFYLLIFPAGFFLAQVYTEGLFVGLAFGSLALLRRKNRWGAALLAMAATWTRAVGVALLIPLALDWFRQREWIALDLDWEDIFHSGLPWKSIGWTLLCFAPLVAFLIWRLSPVGQAFSVVEATYFGRGLFILGPSAQGWIDGFGSIGGNNPQTAAYYLLEGLSILLGFLAAASLLRTRPELGLFSMAVVLISCTSGSAQGMIRYIMGAPATFLFLARLGKNPVFDRAWTIASILVMGFLAMLYTFNLWVA